MSRVRVHNFSVSLDGFGTGAGQSLEAPFGHAHGKLLDWFFATRTFHAMHGEPGGGTTFHFIDASPAEALDLARQAAGDLDIRIGGGPSTVRQFLAADLIDQMHIVVVPIVLGRGERPWDGLEGLEERFGIEAVSTPSGVTHLTFTRR